METSVVFPVDIVRYSIRDSLAKTQSHKDILAPQIASLVASLSSTTPIRITHSLQSHVNDAVSSKARLVYAFAITGPIQPHLEWYF
jgi:hypothetical protein